MKKLPRWTLLNEHELRRFWDEMHSFPEIKNRLAGTSTPAEYGGGDSFSGVMWQF